MKKNGTKDKPKLNLSTMTMGMSGQLINKLHSYSEVFDHIYICDGAYDIVCCEMCAGLPDNVTVFDLPWDDDYQKRYKHNLDQCDEGDWILHLDDDEILGPELEGFLRSWDRQAGNIEIYALPAILHLQDKDNKNKYYGVEPQPEDKYVGQWTKNILYKKQPDLFFKTVGSHVVPTTKKHLYEYIPYPYYHLKTKESFIYNDVWQAFIEPAGQGYDPVERMQFKLFTKQYVDTLEFKKATKAGSWPAPLKKFAYEKRNQYHRPISRLAFVYFYLEGHDPSVYTQKEVSEFMKNVLSPKCDELYEENKRLNRYVIIPN